MKRVILVGLALILMLVGYGVGRASDRDETRLTVDVSSADHELGEGYFALGSDVTLMVKPGTSLHGFLTRQRGQKVTITFSEAQGRQLSRLERDGR